MSFNMRFQRDIDRPGPQIGLGDLKGLLNLPKPMVRLDNLTVFVVLNSLNITGGAVRQRQIKVRG